MFPVSVCEPTRMPCASIRYWLLFPNYEPPKPLSWRFTSDSVTSSMFLHHSYMNRPGWALSISTRFLKHGRNDPVHSAGTTGPTAAHLKLTAGAGNSGGTDPHSEAKMGCPTRSMKMLGNVGHSLFSRNKCIATSNKCIASSNKCLTSSNKKLLETRIKSFFHFLSFHVLGEL